MFRIARMLLLAALLAGIAGCRTSEIKDEQTWPVPGMVKYGPSGTVRTGYGDGRGDSVGGGGAGKPINVEDPWGNH